MFCLQSNTSIEGLLHHKNGVISPFVIGSISYNLNANLTGHLKYRTGVNLLKSSMNSSLFYNNGTFTGSLSVNLNIRNTYLMLSMSRKFMENKLKIHSSIRYGYLGAVFTYSIEKQVTSFSRVDATIILNNTAGVVLKLG